jgi:hypothetical protein
MRGVPRNGHKAYDINTTGVPRIEMDSVDEAAGEVSRREVLRSARTIC